MTIVVQATHDFNMEPDARQPHLLSFRRGTRLHILSSSSNGWSYGSILRRPEEEATTTLHTTITGWFPASYVVVVVNSDPSIPTTTTTAMGEGEDSRNEIWRSERSLLSPQTFVDREEPPMGIPHVPSFDDEYDEGFNAIPMGYNELQSEDARRNPQPYRPPEEENGDTLPPGVKVVPVPERRRLHTYIPLLPQGRKLVHSLHVQAVQPVVRKCTRKKKDAPIRPSVFISP